MTELVNMHISIKGEGPIYTFYVEGVVKSYIDHVIISDRFEATVCLCQVQHDSIINISNHVSVALDLVVDIVINTGNNAHDSPENISWNKLTPEHIIIQYTLPEDERLT